MTYEKFSNIAFPFFGAILCTLFGILCGVMFLNALQAGSVAVLPLGLGVVMCGMVAIVCMIVGIDEL